MSIFDKTSKRKYTIRLQSKFNFFVFFIIINLIIKKCLFLREYLMVNL